MSVPDRNQLRDILFSIFFDPFNECYISLPIFNSPVDVSNKLDIFRSLPEQYLCKFLLQATMGYLVLLPVNDGVVVAIFQSLQKLKHQTFD